MENEIDLVYILGKGSRWHNNEIRFSLRSAEKNFKFRNVVIIGELPDWARNVIHIPAEDLFRNKLQNARTKYLAACNDQRISKDFILMNDDFFFLKPIKKIPYYSRGTVNRQIDIHQTKGGYYYESMKRTKARIQNLGFTEEVMDFEVHAPIVFNKEKLKNVISVVGGEHICLLRTCYGNLQDVDFEVVGDFKSGDVGNFYKQIKKGRGFLSISDSMVISDEFRKWIWETFPDPSKYEEDLGSGANVSPGNSIQAMRYYAKQRFAYHTKQYQPGDRIDPITIREIKLMKPLKGMWEYK